MISSARLMFLGGFFYDSPRVEADILDVARWIDSRDVDGTILNLEGSLSGGRPRRQYARSELCPDALTDVLTALRVRAVSFANNHVFDFDVGGFERLLSLLESANIRFFGVSGHGLSRMATVQFGDVSIELDAMGRYEEQVISDGGYHVSNLHAIKPVSEIDGVMHNESQRGYFAIVDAVIGGDTDGPLHPEPVHSGLIVAGSHALWVDQVCASLMGFSPERRPILHSYPDLDLDSWLLTEQGKQQVRVRCDNGRVLSLLDLEVAGIECAFRPCKNWESILTEACRVGVNRRTAEQGSRVAETRPFTGLHRPACTANRRDDQEDAKRCR